MRSAMALIVVATVVAGCATQQTPRPTAAPDYARPLPPGQSALQKLGPGDRIPDPGVAWQNRDAGLLAAIDGSLSWFDAPSSRQFFPFEDVTTHELSRATLTTFRRLLTESRSAEEFREVFFRTFDVYQSVGWDGSGTVLFTGYYAPEFFASRVRTERFRFPLYRRPANLVTDPVTGEPKGLRKPDGQIMRSPTRRQIDEGNLLAGTELVWLEDSLSAYICHVNGSARLVLRDGKRMYVGYAGKTERPYRGLGHALVREGLVDKDRLGLPAVRAAYERNPARVRELMYENESYVFFREYDGKNWPAGSLGVPVTGRSSLATDKSIYPRAGPVLVSTRAVTLSRGKEDFLRFMLDQDTGGAIKAPGRADIFMGIGPDAEVMAGGQYAEGALFYFFLKPGIPTGARTDSRDPGPTAGRGGPSTSP